MNFILVLLFTVSGPPARAAKDSCLNLLKIMEQTRGSRVRSLILKRRADKAYRRDAEGFISALITEQKRDAEADVEQLLRRALRRVAR